MARERTPLPAADLIATGHATEMHTWPSHPGLWVVYTIYEAERRIKVPLYVGLTNNAKQRFTQHRRSSVWWPLAGDITMHGFYNLRQDASEAEEHQIYALRPLMNITANQHTMGVHA